MDKGIISTCGFILDLSRNFRVLEEVTIFSKTSLWIPKYSNTFVAMDQVFVYRKLPSSVRASLPSVGVKYINT